MFHEDNSRNGAKDEFSFYDQENALVALSELGKQTVFGFRD
jgi:hypothetical protein